MKFGVIVTGAGSGTRFGSDKMTVSLGGKPLVVYSCLAFSKIPEISRFFLTASSQNRTQISEILQAYRLSQFDVIEGGETRQDSVRMAFERMQDVDVVLIHDAARPLLRESLIRELMFATQTYPAVIPVVDIQDTLKQVAQERVVKTVDRSSIKAVQTPQAFHKSVLVKAYEQCSQVVTDEAGLVENIGVPVHTISGDPLLVKLTYPWQLTLLEHLIQHEMTRDSLPSFD